MGLESIVVDDARVTKHRSELWILSGNSFPEYTIDWNSMWWQTTSLSAMFFQIRILISLASMWMCRVMETCSYASLLHFIWHSWLCKADGTFLRKHEATATQMWSVRLQTFLKPETTVWVIIRLHNLNIADFYCGPSLDLSSFQPLLTVWHNLLQQNKKTERQLDCDLFHSLIQLKQQICHNSVHLYATLR